MNYLIINADDFGLCDSVNDAIIELFIDKKISSCTFMINMSGLDHAIKSLENEGCEVLFGYPGGAVLHIYDALYKQDDVEHILVRHEQGATHAADGYARATGKPGVVLVTSGPGATNAVTGPRLPNFLVLQRLTSNPA